MDFVDKYQISTAYTAFGTSYAIYPVHSVDPAPTLLLFAMSDKDTLATKPYCVVGRLLHDRGWNVVSIDLPCHGMDQRPNEPKELNGWAFRIAEGEEITADFQMRVIDVIQHLVGAGLSDPQRIAAAGTSRGGFMAFHAAAVNPQIRAVAGFSPVTDLAALTEFAGMENNPIVEKLALTQSADLLEGRNAWIYIGCKDKRVGTEKAASYALALCEAGCKTSYREMQTPGHVSLTDWHSDAALWFQMTVQ